MAMRIVVGTCAIFSAAAAVLLTLCAAAPAQTTQPGMQPLPALQPLPPLPPANEFDRSAAIGGGGAPLQPVTFPPPAGAAQQAAATTQPSTQPTAPIREGTYLSRQIGKIDRSDDGKTWVFTPDPPPAPAPDAAPLLPLPAMTLLQDRQLAALEATHPQPGSKFIVTGRITQCDYQLFILPEMIAPATEQALAVLAADRTSATETTNAPTQQPGTPLPAHQMLDQMLRPTTSSSIRPLQSTSRPAIDATSGAGAVAPGASAITVLREGTFLVDRTGRLTRGSDGQTWEFNFDADSRAMQDPPVVILPNLKLMAMEQAAKSSNRDLRFRITGMVTEYNGRNYVLLEKVVVVPDVAQQF